MRLRYLYILAFFSLVSCVELYDPGLTSDTKRLVVESLITTKDDYQYVYLTYDAAYNSEENIFKNLVIKAKVSVTDDKGNSYEFYDEIAPNNQIKTSAGYNYRSVNKFKAVVGRTYTLHVETVDGKKYVSKPELALPVVPITTAYYEFQALVPPSKFKGQFNVFIDTKDPAGQTNYYRWDAFHVKEQLYCREWYIYGTGGAVTQAFVDKCCGPCYDLVACEDCYALGNDRFTDGNTIKKQFIGTVPFDNTTNYYMQINQYSMTESAYKFWETVRQQSKNSGGLFDATPKSIKGNLQSVDNPKEEVLGYFGVSDVSEYYLNVNRNITSPKPIIVEEYSIGFTKTTDCYPCQESFSRKRTPPPGWNY